MKQVLNLTQNMTIINKNGHMIELATTNHVTAPISFADTLHQLLGTFAKMRLEQDDNADGSLIVLIENNELEEFLQVFKMHWWVQPEPSATDGPDIDLIPALQGIADKVIHNCTSGSFIARKMMVCQGPKSKHEPYSQNTAWGWEYVPTPHDIVFMGGKKTLHFIR